MEFSIIIPVFNRAHCLDRAISSVLEQAKNDTEVIVVDDGSSDRTLIIAQARAEKDSRLKVLTQHNQGVSAARNCGLREASGDWVGFLDSDDEWTPERLKYIRDLIESNPKLDFIHGNRTIKKPNGLEDLSQRRTMTNSKATDVTWLLRTMAIKTSTVFLRRDCIVDMHRWFDEDLTTCEDYEFFWRMIIQTRDIAYDAAPRVICHDTPCSLTKQNRRLQLRDNIRARHSVWRSLQQSERNSQQIACVLDGLLAEISNALRCISKCGIYSLTREIIWMSKHIGIALILRVTVGIAGRGIKRIALSMKP